MSAAASPLLAVDALSKDFPVRTGLIDTLMRRRQTLRAVDGVSFSVMENETFGIVGESGSGKSTIGKLIARLIEPTGGQVTLDGEDWLGLSKQALGRRAARRPDGVPEPVLVARSALGACSGSSPSRW